MFCVLEYQNLTNEKIYIYLNNEYLEVWIFYNNSAKALVCSSHCTKYFKSNVIPTRDVILFRSNEGDTSTTAAPIKFKSLITSWASCTVLFWLKFNHLNQINIFQVD